MQMFISISSIESQIVLSAEKKRNRYS